MKRKLIFVLLTLVLALTSLAIVSPVNAATTSSSVRTLEYITAEYSASGIDSLYVSPLLGGNSQSVLDLYSQYTPRFSIQNSAGTIVKTGSLNHWQRSEEYDYYDFMFRSRTNLSTAGLPAGHYRVNILLNVHGTSYSPSSYPALTQHFYISSTRTLTQFSQ